MCLISREWKKKEAGQWRMGALLVHIPGLKGMEEEEGEPVEDGGVTAPYAWSQGDGRGRMRASEGRGRYCPICLVSRGWKRKDPSQ